MLDHRGQVAIANARAHRDGARLFIERNLVEALERDLGRGAVGDGIEGVTGAESAQLALLLTIFRTSSTEPGVRRLSVLKV